MRGGAAPCHQGGMLPRKHGTLEALHLHIELHLGPI